MGSWQAGTQAEQNKKFAKAFTVFEFIRQDDSQKNFRGKCTDLAGKSGASGIWRDSLGLHARFFAVGVNVDCAPVRESEGVVQAKPPA